MHACTSGCRWGDGLGDSVIHSAKHYSRLYGVKDQRVVGKGSKTERKIRVAVCVGADEVANSANNNNNSDNQRLVKVNQL
jgi:hypothetical protein